MAHNLQKHIDYTLYLRKKGVEYTQIKPELVSKGLTQEEIQLCIKYADAAFLKSIEKSKRKTLSLKFKLIINSIVLVLIGLYLFFFGLSLMGCVILFAYLSANGFFYVRKSSR